MKRYRVWEIPAHFVRHEGGLTFELNGEHGSVQDWDYYPTHGGDTGVVTPLFDVDNWHSILAAHNWPSASTVFWTVSYSLCSFPYEYSVRYYRFRFQWIMSFFMFYYQCQLYTTSDQLHKTLTGWAFDHRGAFDRRGRLLRGLLTRLISKLGASDRRGYWPEGFGRWYIWPAVRFNSNPPPRRLVVTELSVVSKILVKFPKQPAKQKGQQYRKRLVKRQLIRCTAKSPLK